MTDLQLVILLLGGIAGEIIVAGALTRYRDRRKQKIEARRQPLIKLQPCPENLLFVPRVLIGIHLRTRNRELVFLTVSAVSKTAAADTLEAIFPKSFPLAVAQEIPDIAPGQTKLYGAPGTELKLPEADV
jgi:hypothetical protein